MGDLTKNLSRHEFACKCQCGMDTVDFMLVTMIQHAADYLSSKHNGIRAIVQITSGCRCYEHNAEVGGSEESQHLFCRAADHKIDIVINGIKKRIDTDELADFYHAFYGDICGIGRYPDGRVHIDTRGKPASWDVR